MDMLKNAKSEEEAASMNVKTLMEDSHVSSFADSLEWAPGKSSCTGICQ